MDDSKITELILARDEKALFHLDEKHGRLLRKIANNILRDSRDAEECVNDAYLGVWCTIPPNKPENLAAYVIRIVRNTAAKRYHSNCAKKRNSFYDTALDELEDIFSTSDDVEKALELKETVSEMNTFLDNIGKDERIMFIKRYYFAESVSDIAREMGKSAHYVSVKLFRVREKLKSYLTEKGITL